MSIPHGSLDLQDHMVYCDPAIQLSFPGMRHPENATGCWEEMTLISSAFWPRNAWMSGISHIMAPQYLDKFFKLFLYFI